MVLASYEKKDANFILELNQEIKKVREKDYSDLVFLCIGTDRVTGDCFGPLVGYRLNRLLKNLYRRKDILVVGDLEEPVSTSNIKEKMQYLYKICPNPYIIAIDAAVSRKEKVGNLVIAKEGIKIGKGLDKNLQEVGNISIKAVVSKDYHIPKMNFMGLQNVPLSLVMDLAETTANGIYEIMKYS